MPSRGNLAGGLHDSFGLSTLPAPTSSYQPTSSPFYLTSILRKRAFSLSHPANTRPVSHHAANPTRKVPPLTPSRSRISPAQHQGTYPILVHFPPASLFLTYSLSSTDPLSNPIPHLPRLGRGRRHPRAGIAMGLPLLLRVQPVHLGADTFHIGARVTWRVLCGNSVGGR